jgi:hypothetical protein
LGDKDADGMHTLLRDGSNRVDEDGERTLHAAVAQRDRMFGGGH